MIKMEEIVEEFKVNFDSVVEVNDGGYKLGFEQGIEHAKSTLTEKEITANGEYVPQDGLGFNKVIVNVPDINGSYDNGFNDGQLDGYNNALEKLTELEVNGNGEYLPSGDSIGFKKVVATGYLDTSDANATPEKILDGFTAYVNNEKIEGTIPKYNGESENAEIKTSKLASLVDGTITEVTEKDLAGIKNIKIYAFNSCNNLQKITIPTSVTSIGNNAFQSCSKLTSIIFKENSSLTSINSYAFYLCNKLPEITIPNSVTSIGDYAFYYCSGLSSVKFEENSHLGIISNTLFANCTSLTSIEIPNSVTKIYSGAFQYCSKLTSLTIPASVTSISSNALDIGVNGNSTSTIRFLGTTPPTLSAGAIKTSYVGKIIVPKGYGEVYKSATNFSNLASIIEEASE